jgi:thiol-disulfide isomerase/thioredoxin
LVVAGLAVLAAIAAATVWWTGRAGGPAAQTRPVAVSGAPLPELPDGAGPDGDPARGRPMPEIRGASFDGAPVVIAPDGQAKMIVFLAHWCPHCQAEVPPLVAWVAGGGLPAAVRLYAVSTAVAPDRANYPPSQWLARERWPVPVLADDARSSAAHAAGLSAFPFFVLVAADGRVAARHAGQIPVDELKQRVARLASGR